MLEDLDFKNFIKKFKDFSGIDLAKYKEQQMKRRLTTLRDNRGFPNFAVYYDALLKDRSLYEEFLDRMTINVSEFWRNANRWEVLKNSILPMLYQQSRRLKCWSAACSTGEEPYTLAMILDHLQYVMNSTIIATDLDDIVLKKAKNGIYSEASLREVPKAFQLKYFKEIERKFAVQESLKRNIRFQKQNLLTDSYDSGYDLIICRNVTIYFTDEAKHAVYEKFARALKPGGVLFVGNTEQIFAPQQFGLETLEMFFYRKKD
jgi:chemotaxis protein methyltransferase CheR